MSSMLSHPAVALKQNSCGETAQSLARVTERGRFRAGGLYESMQSLIQTFEDTFLRTFVLDRMFQLVFQPGKVLYC